MTVQPYAWQEPCIAAGIHALDTYRVFANASEMGTGKSVLTCFIAKRSGRKLLVICPKSVVPDWHEWGERIGVPVTALSYGKARTGKTPHGIWHVKGKYFKWQVPQDTTLVFDEAHECGGLNTQQAELLCAARRQQMRIVLLSGTLAETPMKMRAIGYALGLHKLVDFWPWAKTRGVVEGFFGMEWPYLTPQKRADGERIMDGIRQDLGAKFFRIRKSEVPGFPEKQVIPLLLPTKPLDTDAFETGKLGYEARMAAELLKVPGLAERTRDQVAAGNSVAVFVNYLETLHALREEFPNAALICGGQSENERITNLHKFQSNEVHVILVITQAGGTGVSLHDLHGRPRVTFLCPGTSAARFLQAIDRIHRAGSLSHATIYVVFAAGVPVERRSRERMEAKINNLTALNDADLIGGSFPDTLTNPNNETELNAATQPAPHADEPLGGLPSHSEPCRPEGSCLPDQPALSGSGQPQQPGPGGSGPDPLHDVGRARAPGADCHSGGPHPGAAPAGGVSQDGWGGDRAPDGCGADAQPGVGDAAHYGESARACADPGQGRAPAPHGQAHAGPQQHDGSGAGRADQMVRIIAPTPFPAVAAKADAEGNHVVRKHARCSPSKLKNLEICPSYEGDNDGPVHPVTLRGTAMHEALETGDDSGLLTEKDNEELRLVNACREFQDAEAVPGEIVITEPHLKTHDPDVQGFADRVVLEPPVVPTFPNDGKTYVGQITRHARIRDYKMGWNAVDTPDINPQAIAYTVAVFMAYPDVTSVNFAFLIPRLDMILEHTFQRSELPTLKLRLSTIAERVRKLAGKEFNVVDSNCLYCGRKATCAALAAKALPIARSFDEHSEAKLPLPATFDPAQMTDPQQIAYGLNIAAVMEGWIEQLRKRAYAIRKETGVEIPGYDWIERSAKREITNPVGTFEVVTKEFGVTPEAFLSATKISITQLSAVVADAAPKGEKGKAEEQLTSRLMDTMCLTRGASFYVLQRSKKKAPKKAEPVAALPST